MIGMLQGKIWGTTQCIFCLNNVEIHRIHVIKGGYCSEHEHICKHNLFYVESGKLQITIFRDNQELKPTDSTIITAGMSSLVKPGEKHMFEALEESVAYEIYWVELNQNDILRHNDGGVRE